ncbi:MAG: NACHT and WD repeat domain-containing protein, partial [Solirubrobacterales bacterium]
MSSVKTKAPPSTPALEEPYVGLAYFTEEYADRFFGRGRESTVIISNLCAARLTLLYAESGVGKSSVLRAGVVAHLRESAAEELRAGSGAQLVPVIFSSWSERPVAELVAAIGEAIRPYLGEQKAPELPEADLVGALEAASEALDGTLLVILDQFEEYFLYPDEASEQDQIAAQIARCVKDPQLRANFLISIREDSYARLGDLFRGKVKDVYGNFLHLDFLDRDGARDAIEKPIERVNELQPEAEPFTVEPALVDAVLDQVGRDDGDDRVETTFLQLVMRRLWEEETAAGSHVLRLQTLERLGGTQAIIGSHLDRAMEGSADGSAGLTSDQRGIAATIFRFLVTRGGTKIALTAADLAELSGLSTAEIEPVLRHLSSPQLHILRPVVFQEEGSEPRFEIFHDALAEPIRKWRAKVEGEKLEEAQRAAAAAKEQAEQERRNKRIAQVLLALAVVALFVGAAVFAISQKNLADQREADNQSVRAAERIGELASRSNFNPAAAALASVEAYQLSPTSEARDEALGQLQVNPALPTLVSGHTRGVDGVAYWPGSSNFATCGADGTMRLWNSGGDPLHSPLVTSSHSCGRIAVSAPTADGTRFVATSYRSGTFQFWVVTADGEVQSQWRESPLGFGPIWGLAFNPRQPNMLAVGGDGGRLELFDLKGPERPSSFGVKSIPGAVNELAFAADGRSLFAATNKVTEQIGISARGFSPSPPLWTGSGAFAVATAPNGAFALAAGGGISLWNAAHKRAFQVHVTGTVNALAFARQGSVLVSGGTNWNVTTWDVATGRPFGPPRATNRAIINDLDVSPDGNTIAAASRDRLVRLWPLEPPQPLATTLGGLSPGESGSRVPEFIDLAWGGGDRVAAAGPSGTTMWALRESAGSVPQPLGHPIKGSSFAAAYNGNILVTGKGNSFVVEGTGAACRGKGSEPCLLKALQRPISEEPIYGLALRRQDGRLLLASADYREGKGVLDLWDLSEVEEGKISHL